MSCRSQFCLTLIASLCLPQLASAGFNIYTVGGDAACQFAFIQDAIDAAAAHPGGDDIWIAMNRTYADQHLVVTDQDVNIQGGFTDCSDFTQDTALTTIGGTQGHSVIEIEGTSHVYINNLEIAGASMDGDHRGGGIYFGGEGSLILQTTWVHNNQAGYGGGIDMNPTASSSLTLLSSTTISGNTALKAGGGIRIEGPTTLNVATAQGELPLYIEANAALGQSDIGYGGGLEVLGPAVANIGSASIDQNTAPYGAGIAAIGTNQGPPEVNLFTSDLATPVSVHDNTASGTGGGVFLKPFGEFFAQLCAQDFVLSGNSAANGAALYEDVEGGGGGDAFAFLNGICPAPPNAVPCAAGTECNQINDNHTSAGATLVVQSGAALYANHFASRLNDGGELILHVADTHSSGSDYVHLHNCLLANNSIGGSLVQGFGSAAGSQIIVDTCTLAGNTFTSFPTIPVISADENFLEVTNSIVYDSVQPPLFFSGPIDDLTTRYVLANDVTHFNGDVGIIQGAPSFVDAASLDYHLTTNSLGVDFAPAIDGVDLDGNPRTVDLSGVPNGDGPLDLGAYEIQAAAPPPVCSAADTIFCNGFELQ